MQIFSNKANFAWFLVIFGGVVEIFWVSGLKHADSVFWYMMTICGIGISFMSLLIAVRYIEVSVGYAVFVGIGTVGVVLSEILVFDESFSWLKIVLIFTLLFGIIGLKFQSKEQAHLKDEDLARNLGKDLGVHELDDTLFMDIGGER